MAPTAGEIQFVDTNVLLAATDELRPLHETAQQFLHNAWQHGQRLAASGQVLREYLAVSTRPVEANGLGLKAADAVANLSEFLHYLHLCDENEAVSRRLQELALAHDLRGRRLHDANIVATMTVHGLDSLVTENDRDFSRFEGIRVESVAAAAE